MNKLRMPDAPVNAALARDEPEFVRELLRRDGLSEVEIEKYLQAAQSRSASREFP